ncbi:hypothetical protein SCLCIDRAFT_1213116 [Scleroderma citrinum Foug A]|uniref:Uncharacterized protein n=1 Tax=Scleroderma citrinum Foug A TaxID=1036808 RepID=A0A0C3AIB7_9AGAM|nr:hypothetical protein SCLCIDRAFT_1213116 [Scleroderma citrinum Foug A]
MTWPYTWSTHMTTLTHVQSTLLYIESESASPFSNIWRVFGGLASTVARSLFQQMQSYYTHGMSEIRVNDPCRTCLPQADPKG